MRKQRSAAIGIECEQHVPEITRIARQLLGPSAMAVVDRVRNAGVVETGRLAAEHDALDVDFKAGLERAVKELEAESMERSEECHVWLLRKRVAQSKRPVSRELGQQPIGDRRQALVFFWRLLVRRSIGRESSAASAVSISPSRASTSSGSSSAFAWASSSF